MSGNETILDDQDADTLAQAQPYRPGIKAGVDALPGWFKGGLNFVNAVRAQADYRDALEEAQQVLEDNPNSYVVIDMVTSRAGTRDFNVQLYHGTSVGHPRSLDQLDDQAFITDPNNTHFRALVHNLPNADLAYPPGWANRVIHTDYIEPNLSSDNEAGTVEEQVALETSYDSAAEDAVASFADQQELEAAEVDAEFVGIPNPVGQEDVLVNQFAVIVPDSPDPTTTGPAITDAPILDDTIGMKV